MHTNQIYILFRAALWDNLSLMQKSIKSYNWICADVKTSYLCQKINFELLQSGSSNMALGS